MMPRGKAINVAARQSKMTSGKTLIINPDQNDIDLPDHAHIIEPTNLPKMEDEKEAISQALRSPIEAPPLKESVKSTYKVFIVISDDQHQIIY